jgi:hypothetical protein
MKHPAEILGRHVMQRDHIIRELVGDALCPFMGMECSKANRTCSVQYNSQLVAICPNRFLDSSKVMQDCADEYYRSRNDILVFSEVYSGDRSLGSFDYVMARHQPLSSEISDFLIIEVQSVDTTNTGKLNQALRDYELGADLAGSTYGFGLNWANVWKRCFIQIMNKGRVLEQWDRKSFWVVQEPTYQYFVDAYGLTDAMRSDSHGTTVFMVYDLLDQGDRVEFTRTRIESTTIAKLIHAFAMNPRVPSLESFENRLRRMSDRNVSIKLELG